MIKTMLGEQFFVASEDYSLRSGLDKVSAKPRIDVSGGFFGKVRSLFIKGASFEDEVGILSRGVKSPYTALLQTSGGGGGGGGGAIGGGK